MAHCNITMGRAMRAGSAVDVKEKGPGRLGGWWGVPAETCIAFNGGHRTI
jgi:hypothetical protein